MITLRWENFGPGTAILPRKARLLSYSCTTENAESKKEDFIAAKQNNIGLKMPKKFKGTNTKAEETRARREAVKVAEKERKQKEEEDRYWEDNDKHVLRKQQRKVRVVTF